MCAHCYLDFTFSLCGGAVIGGTLFKKICLENQTSSSHLLENLLAQKLITTDVYAGV
jgi:hypothetical protein